MGSIYKRTHKRPIPKNAETVTRRGKTFIEWIGKDDRKHKATLTNDGGHILTESRVYYIKYCDENEIWQTENTKTVEIDIARGHFKTLI